MSKLMWIAGILLIAAGVAFGAVNLASLQPAAAKISLDTSAILLVGGILALGLGSVIDALHSRRTSAVVERITGAAAVVAPSAAIPEFTAGSAGAETPITEKIEAAVETTEVSAETRDTINALEQARQKMEQAFEAKQAAADTVEDVAEEVAEAVEEAVEDTVLEDEVVEEEAAVDDGQLYVVEERFIRRRPARILSDGTVEAETDEGWMRFENLEHLDEYLDAIEPARG